MKKVTSFPPRGMEYDEFSKWLSAWTAERKKKEDGSKTPAKE